MMRASYLLRLSLLPALALLLGALALFHAAPAQAQDPTVAPAAPTDLDLVGLETSFEVTWTASTTTGTNAPTYYEVAFDVATRTADNLRYTARTTSGTATSLTIDSDSSDLTIEEAAQYRAKIRACNPGFCSSYTSDQTLWTIARVPHQPVNLAATPGHGTLVLSWNLESTSDSAAPTFYNVAYTASTTVSNSADVGTDPATEWVDAGHSGTATSHAITGLTNGQEYRVRVEARREVNGSEREGRSALAKGTPMESPTSWKGYALTLSVDQQPSERGADVILTLDLGQPAPPNFWATLEGLPSGTAGLSLNTNAPNRKRLDLNNPQEKAAIESQASDWTMVGVKVQGAGGRLVPVTVEKPNPNGPGTITVNGVVFQGGDGTARLQTFLRDWNGAQTKTVRLRTYDDTAWDPDETIVLRAIGHNFGSPTVVRPTGTTGGHPWTGFGFADLQSNELTLTIVDDESGGTADAPFQVGVLDALTYETGTGAATNAPVTVWLNRPASHDVTVNYATADVTAKSTGTKDYTSKSGAVTIPAGETRAQVTVEVLDDTVDDSGEVFLLKLSNPSPSTVRLARSEATITIRNDELRLADLKVQAGPSAKGPWSELDIGEFSPDTTDYAVTVPYETTHAHLRATPLVRAALATSAGNVNPVGAGRSVALEVGDNTLVMTASGSAGDVKTYRVTVTREAWAKSSNADLQWLLVQGASNAAGPWSKLDFGAFDPDTTEYAVTAPLGTTVARVMATPEYDGNGEIRATLRTGPASDLKPARAGFWSQGATLAEGENAFTAEVTAEDGTTKTYTVTVTLPTNQMPTVSSAIADATITSESETHEASLSGVFSDPDSEDLRVTASSSDKSVATVSVSAGYSTLTVTAKSRGTATITVNADDGNGGSVDDAFNVTVKAAPVVASPIDDITGLEAEDVRIISLSGVFSDADGDSLTITAASSDEGKATVSVSADQSTLTATGVAEGTATITVTAQDTDGNTVTDTFDVTVNAAVQPEPIESEPEQEPQLQQQAAQLPGAVTNLTVLPRNTNITVSWEAPTEGGAPTGYIAHIKPVGGGNGHTMTPSADKTTVKFRRLDRATEYLIWVRAVNEEGKGDRTPIRTATK